MTVEQVEQKAARVSVYSEGETEEPKYTIFGIRRIALIEIIAYLAILLIFTYFFGDGMRYFDVFPHPFWVIILLVSVQYGTNEGLIAALLSTVALLVGPLPERHIDQSIYDYGLILSYRPVLWFLAAIALGEITMRHLNERDKLKKALEESEEHELTITRSYNSLKEIKEGLETRLSSQLHTTVSACNAIKAIETLNPSRILLGIEDLVAEVMNPRKFSLYSLGKDGFESATCVGWDDELGEVYSRRFSQDSELYRVVAGNQRVLCAVNAEDRKILGNEGLLAGPLIDPKKGEVFGMVKIEDIGFVNLNMSNVETFHSLCDLIGMAYANAQQYNEAESHSVINPEDGLLSYPFLERQKKFLKEVKQYAGLHAHIITVKVQNYREFSKEDKPLLAKHLQVNVDNAIEGAVELYDGKTNRGEFHAILLGKPDQEIDIITKNVEKQLQETDQPLLAMGDFVLSHKTL